MRSPDGNRRSLKASTGPLVALLAVVALLPVLVGATLAEHRDRQRDQRRELSYEAREHASVLFDYFAQARSLTRVLSQNPAFRQFYELPGERSARVRAAGPAVREANAALAYLEELFPGRIGEACFIDRGGAENARAVKGRIAPLADLSSDETGASFFAPTFALRPGQVYHSQPYLSPDTNEWVIANSTPIPTSDGVIRAIVHFEITIESVRRAAAARLGDDYTVLIVDARSGAVIIDSDVAQREGGKLGQPQDRRFATLLGAMRTSSGEITVAGHPGAFERLDERDRNANDWIVVALAREPSGSWLGDLGVFELGMFAALLVLLVGALGSVHSSQRRLTRAALDDSLTGLGNRRRLLDDLTARLRSASNANPIALVLCDLDGFKAYNDAFGHLAGDALLQRLGAELAAAVEGLGRAYRMGGDEFCVVGELSAERTLGSLLTVVEDALTESGEAFSITASLGAVVAPDEVDRPIEALRIADQRMYLNKASARTSASRQSLDVLVRVLTERHADLGAHLLGVARLAGAVASRLGLGEADTAEIQRGAQLHDLGKIAIPDAILSKPGALTDDEWAFVRQHTLVGERILGAAPSLAGAAKLVRSSHERIDGAGYPDGLAGDAIPLGARIIYVCDAFDAMTADRPYRPGMSEQEAVDELWRCAGTQFDASVVEAFCAVLAERVDAVDTRAA
jgi:diguanylate cyclase (GGDEF)-like protein